MSKLEESQPKGKITIVPDDHGDKGLASRDYVIQEIAEGNCKNFAIEFAPEYGFTKLIEKINTGKATDKDIDSAMNEAVKVMGDTVLEYAPILKEVVKQNINGVKCKVTEWKAHKNTKRDRIEDDKDSAKEIEKHLSSDNPMLLLAGVNHVSNLGGLLQQNGHDVGFVTAHYKGEDTSLYPMEQVKGVKIVDMEINKKSRTKEKRPSINTKDSYEIKKWQDTTKEKDKTVSPKLVSQAKEIGQKMNKKSEEEKQKPKQQQSQKKSQSQSQSQTTLLG